MPLGMVFLIALAGFAAWGVFLAWRWKSTRDFAGDVFAAKREQGELAAHVDERDFAARYVRAEGPRAGTYLFATALVSTLSIPPLMGVFSWLWHRVWLATGEWEPVARGMMVHVFSLFLFAMAVMILVLSVAMRRYHLKAPPPLKAEIERLNAGG